MANEIQKLYDLPDISFIDGITYETILNEMIADYEAKYKEETAEIPIYRHRTTFESSKNGIFPVF